MRTQAFRGEPAIRKQSFTELSELAIRAFIAAIPHAAIEHNRPVATAALKTSHNPGQKTLAFFVLEQLIA